jgi:hypothetical protein
MGTVTIAATYGSRGSAIGPAVAERLGLNLWTGPSPARWWRSFPSLWPAALAGGAAVGLEPHL